MTKVKCMDLFASVASSGITFGGIVEAMKCGYIYDEKTDRAEPCTAARISDALSDCIARIDNHELTEPPAPYAYRDIAEYRRFLDAMRAEFDIVQDDGHIIHGKTKYTPVLDIVTRSFDFYNFDYDVIVGGEAFYTDLPKFLLESVADAADKRPFDLTAQECITVDDCIKAIQFGYIREKTRTRAETPTTIENLRELCTTKTAEAIKKHNGKVPALKMARLRAARDYVEALSDSINRTRLLVYDDYGDYSTIATVKTQYIKIATHLESHETVNINADAS